MKYLLLLCPLVLGSTAAIAVGVGNSELTAQISDEKTRADDEKTRAVTIDLTGMT